MRSTISTFALATVAVALFGGVAQPAEARMTGAMVENGQHLQLLNKKDNVQAPAQHRRHHVKLTGEKSKRGNCNTRSSTSSSNNNTVAVAAAAGKVQNNAAAASSSSASNAQSTGSSSSSSSSSGSSSSLGSVSGFQGTNTGIGSWFKTNLGSDSTNGQSWCQTWYQDDWPCFAPSVGTMLSNFGGDYNAAAKAYCGRGVTVTNPSNGKSIDAFICDGFDDKWVLSPGSIDLTVGAFTSLYGSFDGNKNTVIQGVQWEFNGQVVEKGTFQNGK